MIIVRIYLSKYFHLRDKFTTYIPLFNVRFARSTLASSYIPLFLLFSTFTFIEKIYSICLSQLHDLLCNSNLDEENTRIMKSNTLGVSH